MTTGDFSIYVNIVKLDKVMFFANFSPSFSWEMGYGLRKSLN